MAKKRLLGMGFSMLMTLVTTTVALFAFLAFYHKSVVCVGDIAAAAPNRPG